MTRTTIAKQANKAGTVFALVSDGITYEVWKRCENYNAQCAGGMKKTWRYVEKDLQEAAARALFSRRTAGTQR